MPVSENPVYGQKRKTDFNDRLVDEWHAVTRPRAKAAAIREEKFRQISELLSGLEYWQFRYRLWLARRYAHVRDEVSFLLGSCWSVVRPMAFELGRRMVEVGTFLDAEDTFYLVTDELNQAIEARKSGKALPQLGALAAERRELRDARKKHRAPAVVPEEARANKYVAQAESMAAQITNDDSSATMHGFAVSSGQVTAKASLVMGLVDFAKMEPGSILVSPLTTPAWTQLFAHAAGLVTDMGTERPTTRSIPSAVAGTGEPGRIRQNRIATTLGSRAPMSGSTNRSCRRKPPAS